MFGAVVFGAVDVWGLRSVVLGTKDEGGTVEGATAGSGATVGAVRRCDDSAGRVPGSGWIVAPGNTAGVLA